MLSYFKRIGIVRFFPVDWANSVVSWIAGWKSTSGTIRIVNTVTPGDTGSIELDVDIEKIADAVESLIASNGETIEDVIPGQDGEEEDEGGGEGEGEGGDGDEEDGDGKEYTVYFTYNNVTKKVVYKGGDYFWLSALKGTDFGADGGMLEWRFEDTQDKVPNGYKVNRSFRVYATRQQDSKDPEAYDTVKVIYKYTVAQGGKLITMTKRQTLFKGADFWANALIRSDFGLPPDGGVNSIEWKFMISDLSFGMVAGTVVPGGYKLTREYTYVEAKEDLYFTVTFKYEGYEDRSVRVALGTKFGDIKLRIENYSYSDAGDIPWREEGSGNYIKDEFVISKDLTVVYPWRMNGGGGGGGGGEGSGGGGGGGGGGGFDGGDSSSSGAGDEQDTSGAPSDSGDVGPGGGIATDGGASDAGSQMGTGGNGTSSGDLGGGGSGSGDIMVSYQFFGWYDGSSHEQRGSVPKGTQLKDVFWDSEANDYLRIGYNINEDWDTFVGGDYVIQDGDRIYWLEDF